MMSPTPKHITLKSINWKEVLPAFQSAPHIDIHLSPFMFQLLFIVCGVILLYQIIKWYLIYLGLKRQLRQKYITLEIKPPSISLQSAFSTKQLFTILHSINHKYTFLEKLMSVKKRISYELVSTKETGIRYILYLPQEDVSIVTKTLRSYLPGVVMNEIEDYLPKSHERYQEKAYSLIEFALSDSFMIPLQTQDVLTQHDPIAYIAGQMTKLDPNELIAMQIITHPITPKSYKRIHSELNVIKSRIAVGKEIESQLAESTFPLWVKIAKKLFIGVSTIIGTIWIAIGNAIWSFYSDNKSFQEPAFQHEQTDSILTPGQKHMQELVTKKISESLFETTIRLYISGSKKDTVLSRQEGVILSLATFNSPGHQELKVKSSFPFTSGLFAKFNYFKLKYRFLSFVSNPILSISEISSFYHFPYTNTTQTEDMQSTRFIQLPAPISLKQKDNNLDIILGANIHGESVTPIGLTVQERNLHQHIQGGSGMGKSTLILHMIHQDLIIGKGLALLDPHGDLSKKIIGIIPKERIEDVIYFNPYDTLHPFGLNVLEIPDGLSEVEKEREKDLIVSTFISIMHKLYADKLIGHRMEHIIRNSILSILELEKPTLSQLYDFLIDTKFRTQVLKLVKNKVVLSYWEKEFRTFTDHDKNQAIGPITNKLGRFLSSNMTNSILNEQKSTIDFETIMNSKKILICNLAEGLIGEDITLFLGSLLLAKIQLAALRRIHMQEDKRIDFFLYVDEFQKFAISSFAQMLSEARKYHLNAILAHQNISQIEDEKLTSTILSNSGTIICFRTSDPKDEARMLPFFAPQVTKGQIANLPAYNFYIKINALKPQDPFTGYIDKFTIESNPDIERAVIEYSRKTYGIDKEKVKETAVENRIISSKKQRKRRPNPNNVMPDKSPSKK